MPARVCYLGQRRALRLRQLNCPSKEQQGYHGKDTKGRRHACHAQSVILLFLRDTVGMDDASNQKRKAEQMYEPRWSALHLDESGEQQCKRDIFGEVRMYTHCSFQTNVTSGADCHLRTPPNLYDPCG